MKYYIIAGEASGDLHGSNLMKQLAEKDKNAEFRFWGGDKMAQIGGKPVKHIKELAFMGFLEVLLNIKTILSNLKFCKKDIADFEPDAVILIDYPGFNMRIAQFAKSKGIKVIYYISPQIWAWKQSRVHKIKKYVDKMLTILPFENEFYSRFDYKAEFTGHPLLDAIDNEKADIKSFSQQNKLNEKPIVALLPGSRKQEIASMLKIMTDSVKGIDDYQFVVAGLSQHPESFYLKHIKTENITLIFDQTYNLLKNSYAALVTSGTATLETALYDVPQVVCYKGGTLSYMIAKRLVKVKYISLVNLIMDKIVVKELIQNELNRKNLRNEVNKLLFDKKHREKILKDYEELKIRLGGKGASERASEIILNFLNKNNES